MPTATTSLPATRTTKGRRASLATSKKASPRLTSTVRCAVAKSTRSRVSVFNSMRLPSSSTTSRCSPTWVLYAFSPCQYSTRTAHKAAAPATADAVIQRQAASRRTFGAGAAAARSAARAS